MTIVSERSALEDEGRRRRDSLAFGYLPGERIVVDPSVVFHTEADPDPDPITYEVVRSKFWNLNMDHEETIRLVSGSNIVIEGYDFNASILTEEGEGVVFGPSNLFFAGCADLCAKWTLEHRSANPGIHDGDVFIQNDPWVGTNHQMDVAVFGPVFWEGRLFGWVYNAVHQREIGGIEPGGFIQSATDVHTEPTFWPPTKFVEGGVL
ncbi:MAG: hydantoinase B/oxoprolinase family protein, partial [Acidimicrobiales bacterium]